MARYIGIVKGTSAAGCSRLGSSKSGITSVTNGWDVGVKVILKPDDFNEKVDSVSIWITGGSHGTNRDILICSVSTKGISSEILNLLNKGIQDVKNNID